ncbi:hypothetical protein QBC35DRAFT_517739 [Podospora australis]|uniref:Uncharacterized protein n=1 Tax=Podospora australis TaxID=1536484 RepID=A0AAN7AFQ4_9PEZI|nr:hypothetical protein QBC35DRAFT_517739 [Podospora australis]
MAFSTHQQYAQSFKCQASVDASLDLINMELGKIYVPQETTLFSLLTSIFAQFQSIYSIQDPFQLLSVPRALDRFLSSIFDGTDSLPFVTERGVRILAGLDDHDKATLYVQAVAGMVLIFQRLVGHELSEGSLSRELRLFSESEQRRNVLERIDHSHFFTDCYTKGAIADLVVETIEGSTRSGPTLNGTGDDVNSWQSQRPLKNNGLPWGFTIMTLN